MEETRDRFSPSGEESSGGKKMARTLPYLTEDICVETSLHCTLDCVFKWKCLSKVWNSYLSSPSFIYNWIQNNNSADLPWNLFYKPESEFAIAHLASHSCLISNRFSFRFVSPDGEIVSPLCSSNGLVLCAKRIKFAWHYYVCNPLTQESVPLPRPDAAQCSSVTCFTCEVSSVSTTYKVVRIVLPVEKRCDSFRYEIQVFASDWGNGRTIVFLLLKVSGGD
ncbi:uncharacterized protein LOC113279263 [Papaver somniferum]|uniref:uncharacterized protein LOC113279263 n=1 Tax=Papaver somniferum TaxID=3469 RepID=UPI000E6FD1E3|nr:uncharacterized protein LOC113279263 [Papaver somniferum]